MRVKFKKLLKELGWREKRMDGGGYLFLDLPDRIAIVSPQIWLRSVDPSSFQIDVNARITTKNFDRYCHKILQVKEDHGYTLFRHVPPLRKYVADVDKDVAIEVSSCVVTWAKNLDLGECLKSNLAYSSEAAPLFTVYRFVALRMLGRSLELESVLERMMQGDQQGFDSKITVDRVRRAIELDISEGL